jgi:hypothetical protein
MGEGRGGTHGRECIPWNIEYHSGADDQTIPARRVVEIQLVLERVKKIQ